MYIYKVVYREKRNAALAPEPREVFAQHEHKYERAVKVEHLAVYSRYDDKNRLIRIVQIGRYHADQIDYDIERPERDCA